MPIGRIAETRVVQRLPAVAIVGRPNVGKSTLFNALTRSRDALVADQEGLTRDRRYGMVRSEEGAAFALVDTGGLTGARSGIEALTDRQVLAAVDEAALVLLVLDGRAGLTAEDERIAAVLRSRDVPVAAVVNKTDGLDPELAVSEFFRLGFEPVLPVSAAHRRGIARLGEWIFETLGLEPPVAPAEGTGAGERPIRMTVIGRPNVGKSTLVNRLLGEERVIAFDAPGTTRDTVEVPWEFDGRPFVLVDTAGIRRRSRVAEAVEKFSVLKALAAIEAADVVLVMLDGAQGVVEQDATLLGHVLDAARPLVVAINKWDGLDRDQRERVRSELDRRLRFVPYAERVFISALHGSGLGELMTAVEQAYGASRQDFSSSRLTDILRRAQDAHHPPMAQGRSPKLRYAHLGGHAPLRIVVHGTRVDKLPESYRRYLANTFRDALGLVGTPLRLDFRQGRNPYEGRRNELTARQLAKRKRLKRFVKRRRR